MTLQIVLALAATLLIVGSRPGPDTIFSLGGIALYVGLLLKIRQHRNWARRVLLGLTVPFLPFAPLTMTMAAKVLFQSPLGVVQWGLSLASGLTSVALALTLFAPSVRVLFTDQPPRLWPRALLLICFLASLAAAVMGSQHTDQTWQLMQRSFQQVPANRPPVRGAAARQARSRKAGPRQAAPRPVAMPAPRPVERLSIWMTLLAPGHQETLGLDAAMRQAASEELLSLSVPVWGMATDLSDGSSGRAALFVHGGARQVILLARPSGPTGSGVTPLLEGLGTPWVELIPNISQQTSLTVGEQALAAEAITLLSGQMVLNGMVVTVTVRGAPLTILTYAESFDQAAFAGFVEELQRLNEHVGR